MTERLPLLFNPRSGTAKKDPDALMRRLPAELRARIEPLPFGPPWDYSEAIDRARRASGPLLVWGGDGTLHHAMKALRNLGCPVPLAAVPGGSGNGAVRGLRTPLEPAGAVQRLLEGRELRVDLGLLDGEPFLNLCGTGFEAAVARGFEALGSRGFLGYAKLALRLWRTERLLHVKWDAAKPLVEEPVRAMDKLKAAWNGEEAALPERPWSLCFANLPQFGAGLWIAPHADPSDGALQWASLRRPSLFGALTEGPALFRERGHSPLRHEGRVLRALVQLDRPAPWHLDGEPAAARDRAELAVEPKAFRLQVTGGCPWT
ncbi:MAG TPA: diacylglycerol kinase family protein [Holophagaceae bacterium]|nr:diacylglycerol kinase family protein [Holophagaceae bacterium]